MTSKLGFGDIYIMPCFKDKVFNFRPLAAIWTTNQPWTFFLPLRFVFVLFYFVFVKKGFLISLGFLSFILSSKSLWSNGIMAPGSKTQFRLSKLDDSFNVYFRHYGKSWTCAASSGGIFAKRRSVDVTANHFTVLSELTLYYILIILIVN